MRRCVMPRPARADADGAPGPNATRGGIAADVARKPTARLGDDLVVGGAARRRERDEPRRTCRADRRSSRAPHDHEEAKPVRGVRLKFTVDESSASIAY